MVHPRGPVERKPYDKLVRDRQSDYLTALGIAHAMRTADRDDDYSALLDAKLREEAAEVAAAQGRAALVAELADLLAVLVAVMRFCGVEFAWLRRQLRHTPQAVGTKAMLPRYVERIIAAPTPAQLAFAVQDTLSVLLGIGTDTNINRPELMQRYIEQRAARGDFTQRCVLVWADARAAFEED